MTQHKDWKILNWNVRGVNSDKKWNSIREKIIESKSEIICLRKTKKRELWQQLHQKLLPPDFDAFQFLPSIGASGGILVAWKSAAFSGNLVFSNNFALSIEFTSKLSNDTWILTTFYAPCTLSGKIEFLEWFGEIDMPHDIDWLVVGDFNLIRRPKDRNKEGAGPNEMFAF